MRGLLCKELLYFKRYYLKTISVLSIFFILLFVINQSGNELLIVLTAVLATFFSTIPIGTFTLDQMAKWDHYALSMPLSRKDLVRSKYVFSLIMVLGGAALGGVYPILSHLAGNGAPRGEVLLLLITCLAVGLLLCSLLLPLCYWLGPDKARLGLLAIALVPMLVMGTGKMLEWDGIALSPAVRFETLQVAVPVLLAGLFYLSYRISLAIYLKKEF